MKVKTVPQFSTKSSKHMHWISLKSFEMCITSKFAWPSSTTLSPAFSNSLTASTPSKASTPSTTSNSSTAFNSSTASTSSTASSSSTASTSSTTSTSSTASTSSTTSTSSPAWTPSQTSAPSNDSLNFTIQQPNKINLSRKVNEKKVAGAAWKNVRSRSLSR